MITPGITSRAKPTTTTNVETTDAKMYQIKPETMKRFLGCGGWPPTASSAFRNIPRVVMDITTKVKALASTTNASPESETK
jgi:hypothetical protein